MSSIRGLRLYFPALEPWVAQSALLPAFCPVYLCTNVGPRDATRSSACPILLHSESYPCATVGPQGRLVVRLPAPFVPHSASLGPATATRVLSTQVPVSAPPTGLDECLFFLFPWCWTSLPFDFLSVLVVRGGAVCLPTPPSWFLYSLIFLIIFINIYYKLLLVF